MIHIRYSGMTIFQKQEYGYGDATIFYIKKHNNCMNKKKYVIPAERDMKNLIYIYTYILYTLRKTKVYPISKTKCQKVYIFLKKEPFFFVFLEPLA